MRALCAAHRGPATDSGPPPEYLTLEKAKNDLLREKQPMLEFSTPEQIGGLAVYLASDAAATITGTTISIDGGWVAQ